VGRAVASSRTRISTLRQVGSKRVIGPVGVRLMMALNDMSLANDSLAQWHDEQPRNRRGRQTGAKMYFLRVLISHTFEALEIVKQIRDTPELTSAVEQCDAQTQSSFAAVVKAIGADDYKRMLRIRNDISFHYGRKIVERGLEEIATEHPDVAVAMTVGSETILWHFEPADLVVDRIVCRKIFDIPKGSDLSEEIGVIVDRIQRIGEQLTDFAGHFIRHHF
jgi:hypothetical protein